MAYLSGGLIEATDYNSFVGSVNAIYGAGGGDFGYGQLPLGTISAGAAPTAIVRSAEWRTLFNTVNNIALHQGSAVTLLPLPVTGAVITSLSAVPTNISTITTNKLNASSQGASSSTIKTNSFQWSGNVSQWTLTMTSAVTFNSVNAARYFFNAGGQIKINLSHPGSGTTEINGYLNTLCSSLGTLVLSGGTCRIAGINYTGTTKIGGGGSATVATATGFYQLFGSVGQSQLISQSSSVFADYSGSTIVVLAGWVSGTNTVSFQVNFSLTDTDARGTNLPPSVGTQLITSFNPPSTTYLTNVWGNPVIS